jgi:SOS-response transcriptional repressor LexA
MRPWLLLEGKKRFSTFLESFVTRNGYSPSFEEIARGMGLKSLATVHKHITNLEKKGMLDRVHNRSRSIDVVPPGTRTRTSDRLPLAGRIAAGLPVEASRRRKRASRCMMWWATATFLLLKCAATPCATSTSSAAIMCWWSARGPLVRARSLSPWCMAPKPP